ncbi:DUF4294 domain-containing protein [Flavobacteriales bacterium]|jgi:hypothetical protein|nr:DUF4294 domain-containing protein [Flavobacteriales bacterium]
MKGLLFISLILIGFLSKSQEKLVPAVIIGNDTVPRVYLKTVKIKVFVPKNRTKSQRKAFRRLKYNVIKVYPYAKLAGEKLRYYEEKLEDLDSERKKKKMMKNVERDLKEAFGPELKKLTKTQGRILLKLIDRETGNSSYALVKEMRGMFSAVMWQTMAKMFGSNLKVRYEPEGQDRTIEYICTQIESGRYKLLK